MKTTLVGFVVVPLFTVALRVAFFVVYPIDLVVRAVKRIGRYFSDIG